MCNAWQHGDECECGFGPPYLGRFSPGPRESWRERSVVHLGEFRRGLEEVGLDDRAVRKQLDLYRKEGFPLGKGVWARLPNERRRSIFSKLDEILRRHRTEPAGEPELRKIRIPLFRLESPRVPGSRVVYEQTKIEESSHTWGVSILGIGTGDTQVLHASYTEEFFAEAGACKIIFLPVTLELTPLDVYRGKKFLNRALRVEARKPGTEHRGVAWCRDRRCYLSTLDSQAGSGFGRTACPLGECMLLKTRQRAQYDLTLEKPGDTQKVSMEWAKAAPRKLGFDVSAFGLGAEGLLTIEREVRLKVTFDLPSGFEYTLLGLKDIDGLAWRLEPASAAGLKAA